MNNKKEHLFRLAFDNIPILEYNIVMARLATTADVFNAIAEPQRRAILTLLAQGERSVNDIAAELALKQPQVSKHLRVLKAVDLVSVRSEGQQHFYKIKADGLKPIHEWVKSFEQLWNERFDRLAEYLRELQVAKPNLSRETEGTTNEQNKPENRTTI